MELRLVVDWNTQGRGANRGVVLLAGASPCYYSAYAHGQKRLPAPKWQPANQESGELHQHCVWHQEGGRFLPVVETLAYTGPVAQRQHGYLKYSAHRMQRATMCHNAPIHASAHHTPPPPATHHAGTTRSDRLLLLWHSGQHDSRCHQEHKGMPGTTHVAHINTYVYSNTAPQHEHPPNNRVANNVAIGIQCSSTRSTLAENCAQEHDCLAEPCSWFKAWASTVPSDCQAMLTLGRPPPPCDLGECNQVRSYRTPPPVTLTT